MIKLRVNGQEEAFDGDPAMPLLWYLRDELGLTGTKFGCGVALCGACTVHVDGDAARACITAVGDVAGRSVTTIEGLEANGNHPVQKAWRALNVPQCGYCQAGQIMQAAALLAATKNPSEDEIGSAMSGNICRCGCYQRITAAIKAAATGA
jgi:isoquinoline 1-oxidoreductase alpha subunit